MLCVDMPATVRRATRTSYPAYEHQVRNLVSEHRKLKGERVVLAVYYAPSARAADDVCLFEVIDGFGTNGPEPGDADLFRFGYTSTPGFPLPEGVSLRMVLASPEEVREAIRRGWKAIRDLRMARRKGRATVVFSDDEGDRLWEQIA